MISCLVIEIDAEDSQTSIQTALDDAGLTADQFLQAVLLKEETKNHKAKIVIFYETL